MELWTTGRVSVITDYVPFRICSSIPTKTIRTLVHPQLKQGLREKQKSSRHGLEVTLSSNDRCSLKPPTSYLKYSDGMVNHSQTPWNYLGSRHHGLSKKANRAGLTSHSTVSGNVRGIIQGLYCTLSISNRTKSPFSPLHSSMKSTTIDTAE